MPTPLRKWATGRVLGVKPSSCPSCWTLERVRRTLVVLRLEARLATLTPIARLASLGFLIAFAVPCEARAQLPSENFASAFSRAVSIACLAWTRDRLSVVELEDEARLHRLPKDEASTDDLWQTDFLGSSCRGSA